MKVVSLQHRRRRTARDVRTTRVTRTTRVAQPTRDLRPVRAVRRRMAKGPAASSELWTRYAKTGPGSKIEDRLVNQYLPLVRIVVGRLAMTLPTHAATEDLYSAGLVGLLNAVRRYNPKTGVLFETYARVRIRGAVFDELRRLDWVPRSVHDKARKVEQAMRRLEQQKGRIPSNADMAGALNMTEEEYEGLLAEIRPATFVCLDSVRSAEQEGETTQHEAVADSGQPDPGYTTARRELARLIAARLQKLPEAQRKVLSLYYFEDLRLREIADVFGVTESRISQIHAAAILSIKAYLHKHENSPSTAVAVPHNGHATRRALN